MKMTGNTILVTGGGSGIGRALAQRLHDLGNRVIVAGRRTPPLEEACRGRTGMDWLPLDVGDADDIRRFALEIVAAHPALNVLVNNAGVMQFEDPTRRRDLRHAQDTVVTNLLGPIRLTDALIEPLRGQAGAAVINVTSGLAFVPLPNASTYSATKAALHSYTVSLRHLLLGQIEVIEIVPPAVRTELTPGQSGREHYMLLDDYIEETLRELAREDTPPEILVERVRFLRHAEAQGRFEQALAQLTAH